MSSQEKANIYQPYTDQPPPPYSTEHYPATAPYGGQPTHAYGGPPQPGFAPPNYNSGVPGYSYSPSSQPQVVVQQPPSTTIIVGQIFYGPHPQQATCLSCQKAVITRIEPTNGSMTWIMCVMLALVGLDCGCCLIPFVCDACKDIEHYCPECGQILGVFNRAGRRY